MTGIPGPAVHHALSRHPRLTLSLGLTKMAEFIGIANAGASTKPESVTFVGMKWLNAF